jgi:hypothetical protein
MALPESCIFYEDSKCLLKGGDCDQNCELTQNANGSQSSDEIDRLIEWRIGKTPDGEGNSGSKSG